MKDFIINYLTKPTMKMTTTEQLIGVAFCGAIVLIVVGIYKIVQAKK